MSNCIRRIQLVAVGLAGMAVCWPVAGQTITGGSNITPGSAPFVAPPASQRGTPSALTPSIYNSYYILPPAGSTVGGTAQQGAAGANQLTPAPATPARPAAAAPVPATRTPATAVNPAGYNVNRYGPASRTAVPVPTGPPPPPSAELAPRGTHKLQSLSGERLYLDGGLRLKLAGIVFPAGAAGNPTRAAIKETIRTAYFSVEPEKGGPPVGDSNYRAWLSLPDGRDVSLSLVAQGVAGVSQAASFRTTEEKARFVTAEAEARTKKLGIWAR